MHNGCFAFEFCHAASHLSLADLAPFLSTPITAGHAGAAQAAETDVNDDATPTAAPEEEGATDATPALGPAPEEDGATDATPALGHAPPEGAGAADA